MSDEFSTLSPGTVLDDRYELTGEIGRGGFGTVYRATQLNVDRDVAIKMIPPEFMQYTDVVQRFEREAKLASQLSHPNTITVHDYGQHDDFLFIVMELLEGEDLADVLNRERTVEPERILRITKQVLRSLAEAHRHNIVHRDLKPENIFLSDIGEQSDFVKVVDFGIAKLAMPEQQEESGRKLTMDGNTVGTPTYMSPEQAAGGEVDAQTDLYALGVIMFEMACGHPPFDAEEPAKTMRQHIFADVPDFSKIYLQGSQLEALVRTALAKEKEDRFQNASDFLDALEDCKPNAPAEEPVIVSPGPPEKMGAQEATEDTSASESLEFEKTAAFQSADEAASSRDNSRRHPPVSSERSDPNTTGSSSSVLTVLEPSQEREVIVLDNPKHKPSDNGTQDAPAGVPNGRSPGAPAGRGLGNPGSSAEHEAVATDGEAARPDDATEDTELASGGADRQTDDPEQSAEWSFEGEPSTSDDIQFETQSHTGRWLVLAILVTGAAAAAAWYYGLL